MSFTFLVILLFALSLALSLWSLRNNQVSSEQAEAKKELRKKKVIYHHADSSNPPE